VKVAGIGSIPDMLAILDLNPQCPEKMFTCSENIDIGG